MNDDLRRVILSSKLIIHEGEYVYAVVSSLPKDGKFFMAACDDDEITVIAEKGDISRFNVTHKSETLRKLFEIKFSPDSPDAAGFLAGISKALSEEDISISVVSTFSKDYIIVVKEDFEKASDVLFGLGFIRE